MKWWRPREQRQKVAKKKGDTLEEDHREPLTCMLKNTTINYEEKESEGRRAKHMKIREGRKVHRKQRKRMEADHRGPATRNQKESKEADPSKLATPTKL
jgi:hypothetical protein